MELKFRLIGFKEIIGKEDKIYYCPLDVKEFSRGQIVYDNKHKLINTYQVIDTILANSELTTIESNSLSLDDFNALDKNITHDKKAFNGFFNAGFICITSSGSIFKNIYLTSINKIGILTHRRVQSNFMILNHVQDDIYNIRL